MLKPMILLLSLLLSLPASAQDLSWAYPILVPQPQTDPTVKLSLPNSDAHFTVGDIDNYFKAIDWFPAEHPPMPNVPVATGRLPELRACAVCHLPNGAGHPESSNLTGHSAEYIIRQMQAFAHDERANARSRLMISTAKAANEAEVAASAAYFSALPLVNTSRVEEAAEVPRTVVGNGAMRFIDPSGGVEPLGQRIIVVPMNGPNAAARDMHVGFVSYVPIGSIAKGAALAAGKQKDDPLACATCHGTGLRGTEIAPALIGQHPIYAFRQLNDMKIGKRTGGNTALMTPVVEALDTDGMIALAAYIGSLQP